MVTTMLVYYVAFIFILLAYDTEEKKFKLKLVTVTQCVLPPGKVMHPDFPNGTSVTTRKISRETTVIDSNFTITKRVGPLQLSYRTYQLQANNVKSLLFKLEKVSCSNPVTFKIVRSLQVDITKDCFVGAGNYHFSNLDLDKFSWFLTKSMTQPGKYAFEIEFDIPGGVVSCSYIIYDLIKNKT